jgi:carboxyl-terminal processing protease
MSGRAPGRRGISIWKISVLAAGAVGIFAFGLVVGRGEIKVGRDAAIQQSVQDSELPADLNYSSVEEVYDALKKNYDGELDEQALLDGIKQGLANASGDNYTEYLNAGDARDFNEELNGTFSGIGAELGKEEQALVIIAPIAGFPAEKAGLRAQDIITEIDGESAIDLSVTEAVKKIRGPAGSKVALTIIRDGQERLEVEITRATINIPSVESEILEGEIGYLKVSRFSDDTAQLARDAAQDFKKHTVKGVILDVRNDPGGLLDASVDLASLWLDNGQVVLQEKRNGVVVRTYDARGQSVLAGVPTVVLINEGSASASEIVAGALKDHGAATLIGTTTFGKGSVQQLVKLPGDGVLKVTIARWFTPNGQNIDKEGIEPDQKVERTSEDYTANRDPQKSAALEFLNK